MIPMKVQEVRLSLKHFKGHSLKIGGATNYAETPEVGLITAGILGLWASRARWSYMHSYQRPLELAGLAVARESGVEVVVSPCLSEPMSRVKIKLGKPGRSPVGAAL